jgi:hypothetical protein
MAITIIYPCPGMAVCPNFIAWGISDDDLPVFGQMVLDPFQIQGNTIVNPGPGNIWQIKFTTVPNGGPWTLVVWDNGGALAQVSPLSVDPAACQQQQPMP